ncbi:hypothetical protein ACH3XW_16205 [Acanthocheilonema viteae]
MLLFAGMMLVYCVHHGTCTKSSPIALDPRLVDQDMTQIQFSAQNKVQSAVTIKNDQKSSTQNNNKEVIIWECGVDNFTKFISESKVQRNCPRRKKSINQCCINHDECYDEQRGRKYCDDVFCECLHNATKLSPNCNKREGRLFCETVRFFGELAYINAGRSKATSTVPSRIPAQRMMTR